MAIVGQGFLQVEGPNGRPAYTRAGQLQVNAEGRLTNAQGLRLQPEITIPAGASSITIAENGMVSATILDSSKLHLFMKTASDIQFGTGTKPLEGVGTPLLTNGADGLGIDLQKLASGMRKHFPDNTSLINKVLEESGTFEIKVVVADMDFRHADGTRLATGKVSVQVPGNLGVARAVQGVTVSGFVKF